MLTTRQEVEEAILTTLNGENKYFPFEFEQPSDINKGSCEEFACSVMAYLGYPYNLAAECALQSQPDLYGHVWLKLDTEEGSLYFDSEVEYGVEDPKDLPFYLNQ